MLACLLVERVTLSKKGIRKFSFNLDLIESRELNSQILDTISKNYWPTINRVVKKSIGNQVKSNQQKINVSDSQQQLDLVSKLTFDIKNSIDKVLSKGGCFNYSQVGYSNLMGLKDKFIMLNESEQSLLSNLPSCKTVMVEIPKAYNRKNFIKSFNNSLVVPRSLKKNCQEFTNNKLYELRKNLIFLHENCHLVLYKNIKFNQSFYLCDEIWRYPVTS